MKSVTNSHDIKTLRKTFDSLYLKYQQKPLDYDPVIIPHRFSRKEDIEITAFIASVFAYGNITAMLKTLDELANLLGENPTEKILDYYTLAKQIKKSKIKYRFYTNNDIVSLFELLSVVLKNYGSLEALFLEDFEHNDENVFKAIDSFSRYFLNLCEKKNCLTHGTKFMFPLPSKNSAAKRMNLFLRWMVRKDKIDFGIWGNIKKSKLIIPLDVHIANVSRRLGFTHRKSNDRKTAEEITLRLKEINSRDPLKYDFSLCHIEIDGETFQYYFV